MKLRSRTIFGLGGLVGTAAIRSWMSTLDYRVAYYDPAIDPAFPQQCRGHKIFIFWHEYILFPLYLRGGCNLVMLLSRHNDAEIISELARHMGFATVRGSTNRGGHAALLALLRKSRSMHLTITPDGPRGPRRKMSPGPIYLASRLGIPLVSMGYGYDRPWRVRSAWDQFAIPRPFSRARAVVSPEIHVPSDLDRDGLEHYRQKVEDLQNRLCDEAEAWAASGGHKLDEYPIFRGPNHPLKRRLDTAHRYSWAKPHGLERSAAEHADVPCDASGRSP